MQLTSGIEKIAAFLTVCTYREKPISLIMCLYLLNRRVKKIEEN